MSVSVEATGHWRTEQIDGVWWFVTPEGHGFFSAGVNNVDSHADYAPALQNRPYHVAVLTKYGTREAWADTTFERLRQWGFNTIGAWSRQGNFESRMPFTPVWGFSSLAPKIPNSTGSGPFAKFARPLRDYFDLRFVDGAADYATGKAHEWSGNPYFLGVFTDNELPWG